MSKMKGPGIFLAQFLRDEKPHNNLLNIGQWVAEFGYRGVQIPTWDSRAIDLDKAAEPKTYCDDLKGALKQIGLEITELSAHLQGQVLAIHPVYEVAFQPFYPEGLKGSERAETEGTKDMAVSGIKVIRRRKNSSKSAKTVLKGLAAGGFVNSCRLSSVLIPPAAQRVPSP